MKDVTIISLVWGEVLTAHRAASWEGWTTISGGLSPHDRSRGYMAARALETDAELFLWLDADTAVTPGQAEHLVASAREHDADIMAAVYPCRHAARRNQVALSISPAIQPGSSSARIGFGEHGSVIPIHATGFGCVVTHRRVFAHPIAPQVDYVGHDGDRHEGRAWFLPLVRGREHLGEDRSFCVRLNEAVPSVRMLADTRISVDHAGYRAEDLL